MGVVVTVSGSVGGIGTSTFAFAIALQAGPGTVLIDAQPDGVPLDVLIGAENAVGTRWSQVSIRSSDIAAEAVSAALPEHHGIRVLSADRDGLPDALAVGYLVTVLRAEVGVIVVDVPARHPLRHSLRPDIDVLLLPPTLPGIVAATHALLPETRACVVDLGFADVPVPRVGEYVDRSVVGTIRWQRAVSAAATAGSPLPVGCDVMRLAARVLGGGTDDV